jgi:allophanate hydrolase subunit 1
LPSGDSAVTVEFSRTIDDAANQRVLALDKALAASPIDGITETVPTYRSLLVHYDPGRISFDALGEKILPIATQPLPPATKGAAGASPSPMAANMASTSRMSPRR